MTGKNPSPAGRNLQNFLQRHKVVIQMARPPPKTGLKAVRAVVSIFLGRLSVAWMEPICRALIQEQELRREAPNL